MTWTRRRFMTSVAAGAAAAGLGARLRAGDAGSGFTTESCRERWPPHTGCETGPLEDRFGEFPLAGVVKQFREDQARHRGRRAVPVGTREAYLPVIGGIVHVFAGHQDARGAIIDPYERAEKQYSTPAFALAGGALCAARPDSALLPAVVRAMAFACASLADGHAADGHADFYTVLLLHADRLLAPLVPSSTSAAWRRDLARIVPGTIYRRQPTDTAINNWNLVAVAGEWLRTRDGFGASTPWIDASLERQLDLFTPWGMYRDPNDPLAYDHFARLWALDLLDGGYRGRQAAVLETLVERGAWMSLFMQSPWGELPCGGRSAHHQWNEAEQAVTFESWASRFARRGDLAAAGACKSAAQLALQSIRRWVRPSGELWIVKNRVDPSVRHGYESYSYHSQYNLLAAAMLAIAWSRADDRIDGAPCPAGVGGFAFVIQPAFHKVFANAGGTFLEIDTGADLHYNPTGILRVHHRSVPPETLSDGVTTAAEYLLPSRPSRSMALGPEWRDRAGAWHALADHGRDDLEPVEYAAVSTSASRVEFRLTYRGRLRGGATSIAERVTMTPERIDIEHHVDGDVEAVRQCWPMLATDGATPSAIAVKGRTADVARGGGRITFEALTDGAAVTRLGISEPCRNGLMDACLVQVPARMVRSKLEVPLKPVG
jgi:hypothetical protein